MDEKKEWKIRLKERLQNKNILGFGKRLSQIRKVLGVTQAELAISLGFDPVIIEEYERSLLEPSASFLRELSSKYQVNPKWILTGNEKCFLPPWIRPSPPTREGFEILYR